MMLAMNALGYDAMVVGNHEYNFGLKNLDRARADANFPWLSANTVLTGRDGKPFAPYLVKTVGGVKVAVIGITTPGIPAWEKPENYARYRFEPGPAAVEKTMAELNALPPDRRPDLILVAAHAGLDRDRKTAVTGASGIPGENPTYEIAMNVPGIDAIVFGHSHQELAQLRLSNGVLLTQPRNWGMSLAEIDFELDSKPGGGWIVAGKSSHLIPVTTQTAPDEELMRIGRPYHEMTESYLNTVVAQSAEALNGKLGRVEDSALVDDIQMVQLHYAQADVSFASLFNTRVTVPKGPVTVRQIAALYLYENELYAIEGDGRMVKEALENAARYFLSCAGATCSRRPLINSHVIGFNYDMAQGVNYEIDLTQPEGQRIRDLTWKGKPLAPDQKLRIAINNYRYGGAAGYSMFKGAQDSLAIVRGHPATDHYLFQRARRTFPVYRITTGALFLDAARRTLTGEAVARRRFTGKSAPAYSRCTARSARSWPAGLCARCRDPHRSSPCSGSPSGCDGSRENRCRRRRDRKCWKRISPWPNPCR